MLRYLLMGIMFLKVHSLPYASLLENCFGPRTDLQAYFHESFTHDSKTLIYFRLIFMTFQMNQAQ